MRVAHFLAASMLLTAVGCVKYDSKSPDDGAAPSLLAVGSVAPNVVGQDANGEEFQLSEYRGKVVMLDFWAGW